MSEALYRKYRPKTWGDVIGQEHVVQTLRNAISANRVSHAYLFAGPRGTGKTTLARILAKAVNCTAADPKDRPCNRCDHCTAVNENRFLDLVEMDAASNTGVDDVRDLRDKIHFTPSQGKFKIYIIDEVHMLSTAAFNALLKTLEEPPPHAIFVLATTEIHKIPATVLSRCQRHEFRRLPVDQILGNLRQIVKLEGVQADEEALLLIARQATGSMRDAQTLLDQLASVGTKITLELAGKVLGTATNQAVLDLIDSIQTGESGRGLEILHRALDSGVDPRTLARQIVEYLRSVLLMEMGNEDQVEATQEIRQRMAAHAKIFSSSTVLRLMKAFNVAATDTRGGWQPSLSLEMALAEAFELRESRPEPGPDGGGGALTPRGPTSPDHAQITQGPGPSGSRQRPLTTGSPTSGSSLPKLAAAATPGAATRDAPQSTLAESSDADPQTAERSSPQAVLAVVAKNWKDIRTAIKPVHPAVEALLNSCKPVEVRGDDLLLGFQSETVRALMDKPENVEVARNALADLLGIRLNIKCVVINSRGKLPPNVPQDGMVATALDHGGEIVDVQD